MKELIIYGEASQKTIKTIEVRIRDYEFTLMDFLLSHGIPVASSCGGDGICQKCLVKIQGEKTLSCQVGIRQLFTNSESQTLSFSYL